MAIRVLSTLALRLVWTGALLACLISVVAAQTPFKIGISALAVNYLPVWMGEAGGFYDKEGLKVEVINMEGGTRGLQVLLSGEIQAMHVGLAPVLLANKQGTDFRLVTTSVATIPITMFTKRGVTMKDLKGKTIGISTFGSETDIAVSILLKQQNLTRQDVTVTQIGGNSQRLAALIAGRIDVAPLIEPAISQAMERGLSPLIDLAAAKTPWIFDALVVPNAYVQKNRDTLTRFVRGYVAGAYLALSTPAKAKEVIAQRFRTKDPKVIDATYNDFHRIMPRDAAPTVAGAQNVIDQLLALGTDIGSRNPNDYLDLSIIESLKKAGYFDQMAKTYPIK
jgi:NitT/TauT family transport system substrate-binding protein